MSSAAGGRCQLAFRHFPPYNRRSNISRKVATLIIARTSQPYSNSISWPRGRLVEARFRSASSAQQSIIKLATYA